MESADGARVSGAMAEHSFGYDIAEGRPTGRTLEVDPQESPQIPIGAVEMPIHTVKQAGLQYLQVT